jgi:hypothetical protein
VLALWDGGQGRIDEVKQRTIDDGTHSCFLSSRDYFGRIMSWRWKSFGKRTGEEYDYQTGNYRLAHFFSDYK